MGGQQIEVYAGDLWKYDTKANTWAWMSGLVNTANPAPSYGTLLTPSLSNIPGGRRASSIVVTSTGTLWLFGGFGLGYGSQLGVLGDMWRFTAAQGWVFVTGTSSVNFVTPNTAFSSPSARQTACMAVDQQDTIWLFGGQDSAFALDDLWYFDGTCSFRFAAGATVSGNIIDNSHGVYTAVKNATAFPGWGQLPASRFSFACGIDHSNNLFIFGGGTNPNPAHGYLVVTNDFWTLGAYLNCPAGTYKASIGESVCTQCDVVRLLLVSFVCVYSVLLFLQGTYSSVTGLGSQTACQLCPCGKYCGSAGLKNGTSCAAGSYSSTGASACTLATPGYWSLTGACSQQPCPSGAALHSCYWLVSSPCVQVPIVRSPLLSQRLALVVLTIRARSQPP